jgi:SAM-dependent methyltransferase
MTSDPGRSEASSIATSSLPPGAKNQSCTTAERVTIPPILPEANDDPGRVLAMVDRRLNYGRDIVARFVSGGDPAVVLDLGPGLGEDMAAVRAAHSRARIVGLEAYEPYAERLRALGFEAFDANIERETFPFHDGTVDLIVANQVFEHVKEIHWILHECARVLRVGASLVIGVPNLASLHNRLLLAVGRQPTSLANWSAHVRGYTKADLMATLDKGFPGGFRLMERAGANFYPLPGSLARIAARAWPGGAWGFFGRFEKVRPYAGSYLEWPKSQLLETNFYLGPGGES